MSSCSHHTLAPIMQSVMKVSDSECCWHFLHFVLSSHTFVLNVTHLINFFAFKGNFNSKEYLINVLPLLLGDGVYGKSFTYQ